MTLSAQKTRITDLTTMPDTDTYRKSFQFLGYEFVKQKYRRNVKHKWFVEVPQHKYSSLVRANDPLIYIGDRRSPPYIYRGSSLPPLYIGGVGSLVESDP